MLTSFIVADSYEAALKEAGDVILSKVKGFSTKRDWENRIFTLVDEHCILWLLGRYHPCCPCSETELCVVILHGLSLRIYTQIKEKLKVIGDLCIVILVSQQF